MSESSDKSQKRKFPWMFLVVLIAVGAVFGYSRDTPGNNIHWAKDVATARAMSAEAGKPILMEFSASWCPACNAMKRNVWPDKQVEQFVNGRVIPLEVDVDAQRVLSSQYGIDAIPALVMTDSSGRELVRAEGYQDGAQLRALVEAAERKMASSTPPAVPLPPERPAAGN